MNASSSSSFTERAKAATRHLSDCTLCDHRCGANRLGGEKGPCRAGPQARVYRYRVEYGEEADLIPSNSIYLSGCDLRCAFCVAGLDAFDPTRGQPLTPALLNEIILAGRRQGVRTMQFVGGEPTIHLPAVLECLSQTRELPPPIAWKSNFCFSAEAADLLEGAAQIYIADFKFGNDACAARIGGVKTYSYLETVTRNLKRFATPSLGRLIVRHLLMPGHFDCCYQPVVEWMQKHLSDVEFSLREGFLPAWRAGTPRFAELGRGLRRSEVVAGRHLAAVAGLRTIY